MMDVRHGQREDGPLWLQMRRALRPEGSEAEYKSELERYFEGRASDPLALLIAVDGDGRPLGLAELSIRPGAEGSRTRRIAYLEGWYVAPDKRASAAVHLAIGFERRRARPLLPEGSLE